MDWSEPSLGKVGGGRRGTQHLARCWHASAMQCDARAAQVVKFIAYSFNGVQAVEPNPTFVDQLKQVGARCWHVAASKACSSKCDVCAPSR